MAALAFVAIFFAAVFLWRGTFADLLWRAAAPLLAFRNGFDSSENARLRTELASTTALLADRSALYAENLQLKSQFGRDIQEHRLLGAVLERPPGIPYDTLLLDVGRDHGVVPGDLVSAGGTTRIGTITEVYANTSRVVLFSTPGESYQVLLRGTMPVTISGQGAGSFAGEVPKDTNVAAGDALVFPGLASGFAGAVSFVEEKEGASFKIIYARLPVNLLELRFVEVLVKTQ